MQTIFILYTKFLDLFHFDTCYTITKQHLGKFLSTFLPFFYNSFATNVTKYFIMPSQQHIE
ncbi:hypothetical protein ENHYDAX1_200106 [Enhydrobacter sp. AX1]|nr:hypothetical protein ENHYDAX1_200106 [Enhydrobacter sp. AX1]